MVHWHDDDELLEPLPPPPAPQAPPQAHSGLPRRHRQLRSSREGGDDADELLTPQTPPMPHTHPLVALSDESARNVKLQQDAAGGMAIHTSRRIFRRRPIVSGKRLDPTFLSRERVSAFANRSEPQENDGPFAVETQHSSRAIALQLQRQVDQIGKELPVSELGEQERTFAATEASARRHELLRAGRRDSDKENGGLAMNGVRDSALKRASERKVSKQLNAKWVQSRQDPSNRPKGPLERPKERHLRETLFRTTASDLLRSGVLYDEEDAARAAMFEPLSKPRLPVVTNGLVGLPGCCFEKY
ncbi:hypothetical protein PHYBOEH_006463 [Phytophthora boehmeriae]|uniref:Uncharacterized protein n=1 Tax=Phytophthora boehmeriae TaxID=109152 RepID=A0A8T1WKG1_9STRA|nr:hypothetical protein PHYBOEH_006463 [Phytophthora boehmeriae]